MAKNCPICGAKIPMLGGNLLAPEHAEIEICNDCVNEVNWLRGATSVEMLEEAESYFAKFTLPDTIKKYLTKKKEQILKRIEAHEDKVIAEMAAKGGELAARDPLKAFCYGGEVIRVQNKTIVIEKKKSTVAIKIDNIQIAELKKPSQISDVSWELEITTARAPGGAVNLGAGVAVANSSEKVTAKDDIEGKFLKNIFEYIINF